MNMKNNELLPSVLTLLVRCREDYLACNDSCFSNHKWLSSRDV